VVATADGSLWVLERRAFKAIMMRAEDDDLAKTVQLLGGVEVLSSLHNGQLSRLADVLSEKTFEEGEVIVQQADTARHFYLVLSAGPSNRPLSTQLKHLRRFEG